jgi:hypothetical protein
MLLAPTDTMKLIKDVCITTVLLHKEFNQGMLVKYFVAVDYGKILMHMCWTCIPECRYKYWLCNS